MLVQPLNGMPFLIQACSDNDQMFAAAQMLTPQQMNGQHMKELCLTDVMISMAEVCCSYCSSRSHVQVLSCEPTGQNKRQISSAICNLPGS